MMTDATMTAFTTIRVILIPSNFFICNFSLLFEILTANFKTGCEGDDNRSDDQRVNQNTGDFNSF
jgi:hypothetical protein